MIKAYFGDLFKRIKGSSLKKKIFLSTLILIYIFIFCISIIPVNYTILTPGTINNTKYSVDIKTENERGQICTVGVYEHIRPTVLQYWLSMFNEKMDVFEYNPDTDLSDDMETQYGIISKKISIYDAIIVAYEKAMEKDNAIKLVKKYEGVVVAAIFPNAITDLKTDDIIFKVNGEVFTSYNSFIELVRKYKDNETLEFTVKRKGKEGYNEVAVNSKLVPDGEVLSLGISVLDYTSVDGENSNPKFSIPDDFTSIGSSGGSLTALSIYNALTTKDITKVVINGEEKALRITGTGTISTDGTIGSIGGVQQKVLTAYLKGADVFFVDSYDYEDAIEALDLYDINEEELKIIKVETFNDMINALESWGE